MKKRNSDASRYFAAFTGLLLILFFSGCSGGGRGSYQSNALRAEPTPGLAPDDAFHYHGEARNPVVVIHGLLGARLLDEHSGQTVWGRFSELDLKPEEIFALALPMKKGKALQDLKSPAVAQSIMGEAEIRVAGMSFRPAGYNALIELLNQAGYEGGDLLLFPYDWRRDIAENAAELDRFLKNYKLVLEQRRKESGKPYREVQFDLVAHSMGGLLAGYYVRYGGQTLPEDGKSLPVLDYRGSKLVDKVIMAGTPNDGYLDAFLELIDGLVLMPGAPRYPAALLGTFPSYYQMLPGKNGGGLETVRNGEVVVLDAFDFRNWKEYSLGLADPAADNVLKILLPEVKTQEERRRIALDHLEKCLRRAGQFRAAMARPAKFPPDIDFYLFAGNTIPTSFRAELVSRTLPRTEIRDYRAGDGKIAASSARFDRNAAKGNLPFLDSPVPWRAIYHAGAAHMGLFGSSEFRTNAPFILLRMPSRQQKEEFR